MNPNEEDFPDIDRNAEIEGDDGKGYHEVELDLSNLPAEERAELEEQVARIEREAEENPRVGH